MQWVWSPAMTSCSGCGLCLLPARLGGVDVIEGGTTLLAVLTLKETLESSEACEVMVLSLA